jgi:ABC-type molybdenum transport system ATPase subunit/photorepair protein PhrA
MIEPESDAGVLIIGPSGSGKSTLALQLAQAGWSYLSDDELLLGLRDGAVEARGFRSFFAVRAASAQLRHCFEPEAVFESRRVQQAFPKSLYFIGLNGESRSNLSKLTQAETMQRLIRACPWATYDTSVAGANLELLSTLARQACGFDLSAGSDLLDPGFAASFLK